MTYQWEAVRITQGRKTWYELHRYIWAWTCEGSPIRYRSERRALRKRDKLRKLDQERQKRTEVEI